MRIAKYALKIAIRSVVVFTAFILFIHMYPHSGVTHAAVGWLDGTGARISALVAGL